MGIKWLDPDEGGVGWRLVCARREEEQYYFSQTDHPFQYIRSKVYIVVYFVKNLMNKSVVVYVHTILTSTKIKRIHIGVIPYKMV